MTVIAWDGKTLASDSLESTGDGFYIQECKKLYRLKSGGMIGTAGDSDCRALMALVENVKDEADLPTKAEIEATRTDGSWILVLPDRTVFLIYNANIEDYQRFAGGIMPIKGKAATGHGQDLANAAMYCGLSAADAVRVAIKFSRFCAGPVQTMTLADKPKEKIKRVRPKRPIEVE